MNKAYMYIVLSAFIFSTMELAAKIAATDVNPFQLNLIRFLIGALVLFPIALQSIKKKNIEFSKDDFSYFLFTGFLNVVVSMSFFQLSLLYIPAATVAVIFSTNPIFITLFARLLLKEKLNKTIALSLAISICGVLIILNPFDLHTDFRGVILIILSAATFALYSVIAKMRVARYGSITLNCLSFLAGDAILLMIILVSHLPFFKFFSAGTSLRYLINIPIIAGINSDNIAVLIYLGAVVTGLGFLLYFMAMEKSTAATGSIVFFLKPALAPIFCYLFLQEHITPQTMLGILLILTGAYLTMFDKSRVNHSLVQS